jgi:mRNA-degrading endonuclease RelE of RelBE toxin-antitoxin system
LILKFSKALRKSPKNFARWILTVIESLPQNPYAGDIQKMEGEKNVWRRRIGHYRIFYEIIPKEKIVHVFHTERRTSKTY